MIERVTAAAGGVVDGSGDRLQLARQQHGTRRRRQRHVQRGQGAEQQ
ncbi:unnamed protein product [Ectocarpus sp. 6 AP-2014]